MNVERLLAPYLAEHKYKDILISMCSLLSGGNPELIKRNDYLISKYGEERSSSYGLFQIVWAFNEARCRSMGIKSPKELLDVSKNVKVALDIFDNDIAYYREVYKSKRPEIYAVAAFHSGRSRSRATIACIKYPDDFSHLLELAPLSCRLFLVEIFEK